MPQGISKFPRRRWTKEDDEFIIENYPNGSKDTLLKQIGRSWDAIVIRAAILKISRSHSFKRESDLSVLCDGSFISHYWIGFILADGHISEDARIRLKLSIKDKNHLTTFGKFISCQNIKEGIREGFGKMAKYCSLSVQNKEIIPELVEKFDIQSNKTINPPAMRDFILNEDSLFAMFVGFFDGDGNIAKRSYGGCLGKIKIHANWLDNLCFMREILIKRYPDLSMTQIPQINKQGYAEWSFGYDVLRAIKADAEIMKLPLLERKWVLVKPHIRTKPELILYVLNSPKSYIELSKELNMKYSTIYNIKHRHKNKNKNK